jgi:hypothetical protein
MHVHSKYSTYAYVRIYIYTHKYTHIVCYLADCPRDMWCMYVYMYVCMYTCILVRMHEWHSYTHTHVWFSFWSRWRRNDIELIHIIYIHTYMHTYIHSFQSRCGERSLNWWEGAMLWFLRTSIMNYDYVCMYVCIYVCMYVCM